MLPDVLLRHARHRVPDVKSEREHLKRGEREWGRRSFEGHALANVIKEGLERKGQGHGRSRPARRGHRSHAAAAAAPRPPLR